MKSIKILIVTKFFHPEITPRAFRAFELAKEFAKQGHKVTVLTTVKHFDYSKIEDKYGFTIKPIVKNELKEIQGGGLMRVLRYTLLHFFQYPYIKLSKYFKAILEKEKTYDLLISIAHPYPVHFGVALARSKNKDLAKAWVADCGDPFAGNQHGRLPYPFYYRWVEKWFCKRVDYITIPIEGAMEAYPKKYNHKIKVIPQGFDFKEITPNFIKDKNAMPTFAYAGNLSPGLRDPRPLLDVLATINKDFKFVIYTKNKGFLSAYNKRLGNKLEFRDYVPRNVLLKELGQMDFLINLENKGATQQPSKLIDYALLKRPIMSIAQNNLDKSIIMDFIEGNYNKALTIENIEQYNIVRVAKEFLALLKNKN